jgi:hypothetical protein
MAEIDENNIKKINNVDRTLFIISQLSVDEYIVNHFSFRKSSQPLNPYCQKNNY